MRNRVFNVTTTGAPVWDTLGAPVGWPNRVMTVYIQARTNVDVLYRWVGQTDYWTIKAGTIRTLQGNFGSGDLQIQAAAGTVVEIEISTQLTI